jgi:hypothetical protein
MPKINLVQIGSETAGLRIDDLFLFGFFVFLAAAMLLNRRTSITTIEILYASLVAEGLISNWLNVVVFDRSSGLYSFRLAEYFLFFYLGYYFATTGSLSRVSRWLLVVNGIAIILQQFGILGAATSDGLVASVQERPVGLTGGPWEVGAIINFCFAILVFDQSDKVRVKRALWLFAGCLVLLLITASRMALVAQIVLLLVYFYRRSQNALRFVAVSVVTATVAILCVALIPNPVAARSENLFTTENFRSFETIYNNTPDNPQIEGMASFAIDDGGDMSWLIRSAKWAGAIKGWNRGLFSILFGIGPGTLGPSLDGGWLRILSEMGLAGLTIFIFFFRFIVVRFGWQMRGMVVALSISMLMIDIHIAYKAMSFFLFSLGYFYHKTLPHVASRNLETYSHHVPPASLSAA